MLDSNKIVVPVQTVEISGYVISSFTKTAAGPGGLVLITTRQDKQLLVLKERNDAILSEVAVCNKPQLAIEIKQNKENKDASTCTDENTVKDVSTCTQKDDTKDACTCTEGNSAKDTNSRTNKRRKKRENGKCEKRKRFTKKRVMEDDESDDLVEFVKKTSSTVDVATKNKIYRKKKEAVKCFSIERLDGKKNVATTEGRAEKKRSVIGSKPSGGTVHRKEALVDNVPVPTTESATSQSPAASAQSLNVDVDTVLETLDGIPPYRFHTRNTAGPLSYPSYSRLGTTDPSETSSTSSDSGSSLFCDITPSSKKPIDMSDPVRIADHGQIPRGPKDMSFPKPTRRPAHVLPFPSNVKGVDGWRFLDDITTILEKPDPMTTTYRGKIPRRPQDLSYRNQRRIPEHFNDRYRPASRKAPEQPLSFASKLRNEVKPRVDDRLFTRDMLTDYHDYHARSMTHERQFPPDDLEYRSTVCRSRTPERQVAASDDVRTTTFRSRVLPEERLQHASTAAQYYARPRTDDQPTHFGSDVRYQVTAHNGSLYAPTMPAQPQSFAGNRTYIVPTESERPLPAATDLQYYQLYGEMPPSAHPVFYQRKPKTDDQPTSSHYHSQYSGVQIATDASFHTPSPMDVDLPAAGLSDREPKSAEQASPFTDTTYKTAVEAASDVQHYGKPKVPERSTIPVTSLRRHIQSRTPNKFEQTVQDDRRSKNSDQSLFTQEELQTLYHSLDRIPNRVDKKSPFPYKRVVIYVTVRQQRESQDQEESLQQTPAPQAEVYTYDDVQKIVDAIVTPLKTVRDLKVSGNTRRTPSAHSHTSRELTSHDVTDTTPSESSDNDLGVRQLYSSTPKKTKPTTQTTVTREVSASDEKRRVRRKLFSDAHDNRRNPNSTRNVRFQADPETKTRRPQVKSRTDISPDSGIGTGSLSDGAEVDGGPSRSPIRFKTHFVPITGSQINQNIDRIPVITIASSVPRSPLTQPLPQSPPTPAEIQEVLEIAGVEGFEPAFVFRGPTQSSVVRPGVQQYTILYKIPPKQKRPKSKKRDDSTGSKTPKECKSLVQFESEEVIVVERPSTPDQQGASMWEKFKSKVKRCCSKEKQ